MIVSGFMISLSVIFVNKWPFREAWSFSLINWNYFSFLQLELILTIECVGGRIPSKQKYNDEEEGSGHLWSPEALDY